MADKTDEAKQPISPAKRRILQQQFDHASKMMAGGQYDYATELFSKCVVGDPGNQIYVSNFLGNLQKKYDNNKKGSKMAGMRGAGAKAAIKKAVYQKNWLAVIEKGLEVLKLNPWDAGTLMAMANACDHLEFEKAQVVYLKAALEADIKNVDVNRALARALEAQGDFDGATLCWRRVLKGKPGDDEAAKGISNCSVKKTMKDAKYEEAGTSTDVMVDKQAQSERRGGLQLTEEQKLEKTIKKNPENVSLYIELADMHSRAERYDQAEEWLHKALEVSGGDINIREKLEDAKLRKLREQVAIAAGRAAEEATEEAKELHQKYVKELNQVELEMYSARSDRYPNNLALKFELGVRLQRAGKVNEAIKAFQEARGDPQRKGDVMLYLGECFQKIKQYRLALTHFEDALEEISERHADTRKRALYNAGRLALDMKELEKAEKHLSVLAGIDFGYLDVAELLDKIRQLQEEEEEDA